MSSEDPIHFGSDLIAGTLQLLLEDFHKKFSGDLLNLTTLDLLASQYKLEEKLASTWDKLLQPAQVYQFLIAVSNGYQIDCGRFLPHFRTPIQQLVNTYLAAPTLQRKNRRDLISALDQCIETLNTELAIENYDIILDEAALESPFDPDYESEQYYEHQARLDVDENYAAMTRYNAKLKADAT